MGFFASSGILNQRGFFSAPTAAEAPPPPPPPSGIPASTQTIIVTNSQDGNWDYTYEKNPDYPVWEAVDRNLELQGTWRIRNSETNEEINNPSSDPNFIPTSGWTKDGSPFSITITAA